LGLAVFSLGCAFADASYAAWRISRGVLPTVETPYNHIRMYEGITHDSRRVRVIQTDPGKIQSGVYLDDPVALYCEYTRYIALARHLVPEFRRVLVLGGGGYSVPRWLLAEGNGPVGLEVDVVELDPGMTDIARKYFFLPDDPRLRAHHEDARRFLNKNKASWDIIFVDVFNSWYSVPFQMGTREATLVLRRAVSAQGAVMMNVISAFSGEKGRLFQAVYSTLTEAFGEVHVFAVEPGSSPGATQNLLILALPEKRPELAPLFTTPQADLTVEVRRLLRTRITRPIPVVASLTDDFAPVERYAQKLLD
jgi:spermidine synthase